MVPASPLDSLRQRLAEMRRSGVTPDKLAGVADTIGRLLLNAVEQEGSLLREELHSLCAWLGLARVSPELQEAPSDESSAAGIPPDRDEARDPERSLFTPQPGMGDRIARRFAPLQLLLQLAANSPRHRERVASLFMMNALQVVQLIEEAIPVSTGQWSQDQLLDYLELALPLLEVPDTSGKLTLDDRILQDGDGHRAKLSLNEAKFMNIVLQHRGEHVPKEVFESSRLRSLPQLKSKLLKKLSERGFRVEIKGDAGGYMLALPS